MCNLSIARLIIDQYIKFADLNIHLAGLRKMSNVDIENAVIVYEICWP